MDGKRAAIAGVFGMLLTACSIAEVSPPSLAAAGAANMRAARTTHVDGTGSVSLRGAIAESIAFRVAGDAALPDRARMTLEISGMALIETITIAGRSYVKDGASGGWSDSSVSTPIATALDPFSGADLAAIEDVVEVDRPIVDGQKTRHLRYVTDAGKLLAAMGGNATSSTVANPRASGELWIRVSDTQIVRQVVAISFELDPSAFTGLTFVGSAVSTPRTRFEMSMDLRFSRHGQAMPTITPPPAR